MNFSIDQREKRIHATCRIPRIYQGYAGIVHGGILALLLDEAVAKLSWELGLPAVTGEITVRYPSPLHTDEEVRVQGRLFRVDRRIILAEARAEKEDGTVVAEAKARLFRQKLSDNRFPG